MQVISHGKSQATRLCVGLSHKYTDTQFLGSYTKPAAEGTEGTAPKADPQEADTLEQETKQTVNL